LGCSRSRVSRPPASSAAPAVPAGQRYVVKRGNNLWLIARRTYGDGLRYMVIYSANRGHIRNPNVIYPGQPVTLPQSCAECHQTPVTGAASQVSELRAGHKNSSGAFVDAPGGSLINDRAVDASIQELVEDMIETMHAAPGVGLSAPQVAVPLRIIVTYADEKVRAVINRHGLDRPLPPAGGPLRAARRHLAQPPGRRRGRSATAHRDAWITRPR